MTFYVWRHRIPYRLWLALGALGLIILAQTRLNAALLLVGAYPLFYLGYSRLTWLMNWTRRSGDYSYGLYLYAWPIQQLLVMNFGDRLQPTTLFAWAFVATFIAAFVSWHLIEKPCLRLKRSTTSSNSETLQCCC